MAGRKIVYEMFPLGFGEFLDFCGIPYRKRVMFEEMRFDPHEFERLKIYYDEFITYGGLPNVVLEPKPDVKREILNEIFSSYINLNVQVMADFRKIGELQQLLKALAMRMGNKLDYSKLSQIIGISRPTLNEYLEFLEKTYVIYRLPSYASPDKSIALGKKLYFRDNGIAGILAHPGDGELAYLSKGNEYEVDFVVNYQSTSPIGLEVKYHSIATDYQKLKRIAQKNGLIKSWLVGRYAPPGYEDFLWGGLIF